MSKPDAGSRRRNVLDIKKASAARSATAHHAHPQREAPKAVRLRTKRLRRRVLVACLCVASVAASIGSVGALTHIQRLSINDILVLGSQKLEPAEVVDAVEGGMAHEGFKLFSRKNIFLYPKENLEISLSVAFPRIKDVSVTRDSLLSQAVIVTLKEREAYAVWCSPEDACFVMESSGYLFASSTGETPKTPYVFRKGLLPGEPVIGQTFLRGRVQQTVRLLGDLSSASFKPTGATIESERDFSIQLEDGPYLMVSFDMTADDIIGNLQTALKADSLRDRFDELAYIDLRFGNRVYYK